MSSGREVVRVRRARLGTSVVFTVHGLLFASWTAHIPAVQSQLGLDHAQLGLALLGAPLGAVIAMIGAGKALARWGSRSLTRVATAGYCAAGPLIALSGSPLELAIALAVWGAFQGSLDVFMNTQATRVEALDGRAIMASFHGWWSIGAFVGALTGAVAVGLRIDLGLQLAVVGVLALVVTGFTGRILVRDNRSDPSAEIAAVARTESGGGSRGIIVLGAIAFACMLCEGAVADWSAIHLREDVGTSDFVAGLGYACFAVVMVCIRLTSTRIFARVAVRPFILLTGTVATAGMGVGLATQTTVLTLIGLGTLGLALATIVPSAFSAAGRRAGPRGPGTGIATVSALGWAGFVCGPPLIGVLAQGLQLTGALALIPVLTAVIVLIVHRTRIL